MINLQKGNATIDNNKNIVITKKLVLVAIINIGNSAYDYDDVLVNKVKHCITDLTNGRIKDYNPNIFKYETDEYLIQTISDNNFNSSVMVYSKLNVYDIDFTK